MTTGWLRAPAVSFRGELPQTASGKIAKSALREEDPFNAATIDTKPAGVNATQR